MLHRIATAALAVGVCVGAALTAACHQDIAGPSTPVYDTAQYAPGVRYSLTWQGKQRTFRFHLPDEKPWSNLPLVIALHGAGSSADEIEPAFGFNPIADSARFAIVYPNGYGGRWNVGGPSEDGVDDVGFVGMLIDTLARRYPVDRKRVFVTGFSNGGFMAYRLARELSDRVIAVAPVAASLFNVPYGDPRKEVAVLHIHALDDNTVPFEGEDRSGVRLLPVDSTLAYFIRRQRCATPPEVLVNNGRVYGRRWHSASGHGDVLLYVTTTGGHHWPTADSAEVAGTALIWSFFRSVPNR